MANDLVPYNGPPDEGATPADGVESPESYRGTLRRRKRGYSAEVAERDAEEARRRHDYPFAVQREEDASEHRQSSWDWGDNRTWFILIGLFIGGVALALSAYFLPQGQHAGQPPIHIY